MYTALIPDICHIVQMWDMWRKIFHVEKFQISIHGKCGYIWNAAHLSCGDMRRNFKFLQNTDEEKFEILHICQIQNFSTWEMWINLKFLHIMCRVFIQNIHFFLPTFCFESTICVKYFTIHRLLFTLFNFLGEQSILYCFYSLFFRFTQFSREIYFVAIHALLCGEKLNQKLHMWRKMTNIRYVVVW